MSNKVRSILVFVSNEYDGRIKILRHKTVYECVDPTPASLARVMRVMQGKPAFGECCEWEWNNDFSMHEVGCFSGKFYAHVFNFCPYCGRRLVTKDAPTVNKNFHIDTTGAE